MDSFLIQISKNLVPEESFTSISQGQTQTLDIIYQYSLFVCLYKWGMIIMHDLLFVEFHLLMGTVITMTLPLHSSR